MYVRKALLGGVAVAVGAMIALPTGAFAADDDQLHAVIDRLEQRVVDLEQRLAGQEALANDVHRLEGEIVVLQDDTASWRDVAVDSGSDFNVSGYVETSYNYNLNSPRGPHPGGPMGMGTNHLRIFDFDDDTFDLNAARLTLENTADEIGDAGFRVDLTVGTLADSIASANTGNGLNLIGDDDVDLTQAYVNYIANVGNGLELKAGKFVTWIGYEVIEAHNNPNYSRSLTFGLSIPFAHTGIGASYQFNDLVAYSHYLVNGWDNALDENDGKSMGGQLVLTPEQATTFDMPMEFYFNYIFGREGAPEGDDDRYVLDFIWTTQIDDQWATALNIDYGESEFEDMAVGTFDDDEWLGIAAYVTYQHTDALGFALRAEYWEEENGTRTGLMIPVERLPGTALEVFEITGTVNYWVTENLYTRAELRYDDADSDVFVGDGPMDWESDQFTVGLAATYLF